MYDCYFWIDHRIPEQERCISVMCVECHDEKMPDTGWLYNGAKDGFGPFDYICDLCGKVIHKGHQET